MVSQQTLFAATLTPRASVPEILEADGNRKILDANGRNDCLQFVPALARDANFFALNLRRDLELALADEAGDLFRDERFDALPDFDDLPRMAERRKVRLALIHTLEADAAFRQLADDDFDQRLDFELIFSGEFDFVFFQGDFGVGPFEIEAVGQFLPGLVDGVLDFHRVDLRNDV